ncbi:hypothetical protein LQZ18_00540 [Lachnospiraceae bacterium ZAX-1]
MEKRNMVNKSFAAPLLIQILYERGLINKTTLSNVQQRYGKPGSHVSQAA